MRGEKANECRGDIRQVFPQTWVIESNTWKIQNGSSVLLLLLSALFWLITKAKAHLLLFAYTFYEILLYIVCICLEPNGCLSWNFSDKQEWCSSSPRPRPPEPGAEAWPARPPRACRGVHWPRLLPQVQQKHFSFAIFFVNYDCRAISYSLAKIQPSFEANFLPLVFVVSCNGGNLANIEPVLMLVPVADTAGAPGWRAGWGRSRSSATCSAWTPRSPRRGGRGVTGATPRLTPPPSRPCLTTRPGPWRIARRSWRSGGSEPSALWVPTFLYNFPLPCCMQI